MAFGHGKRWALVDAASRSLKVELPSRGPLRVARDDRLAGMGNGEDGHAVIDVPLRAWRTAAP